MGPVFDRGKKLRCNETLVFDIEIPCNEIKEYCLQGVKLRCQLKKGHSHAHTTVSKIKNYGFFKLIWGDNLIDKLKTSEYHFDCKNDRVKFSIGKVAR